MGGSTSKQQQQSGNGVSPSSPPRTPSEARYLADPPPADFSSSSDVLATAKRSGSGAEPEGATANGTATAKGAEPTPLQKYVAFRDQLMEFSLGESAFNYAERMFQEHPENPEVMALLAETTTLYDKTKNKHQRDHWIDRLDLLQRGIDVSRKCIKEHPEYGPCYRTYVMCAVRASESLYYYRWMRAVGLLENYQAIMKRGKQGLERIPDDSEIPKALGMLSCRCAYEWYNPYRLLGWIYGVPSTRTLHEDGIKYLKIAVERNPADLETACRLGMAYFHAGDFPNARRMYCKVRDELTPQDLKDHKWQSFAHTQLSTAFEKNRWNVPFA